MRILIADDDNDARLLLSKYLKKLGFEAIAVNNGAEAWEILQKEPINFIISDWMMPGMDGLQLCKKIRNANFQRYIYIILLTAKNAKDELIAGMEAGADDFIVKPFNKGELKVRIRAGERILKLEKDLEERNTRLSEAYFIINKDLKAAAAMQKSLLPDAESKIAGVNFEWTFLPCSYVAGDIFNFFRLDEHNIGFYLLDVSGHGIQAAMLSVTLSKMISPVPIQGSPLKQFVSDPPHYVITPPASAVKELNQRFHTEQDFMQYFTMLYGIINIKKEKITFCQAGHPAPLLLQNEGEISLVGSGGFPVGMLLDMEYENTEMDFKAGDRLIVYSDGITECTNKDMKQYSLEQLMSLVEKNRNLPLKEILNKLEESLYEWRGSEEFVDDVSILAIARKE